MAGTYIFDRLRPPFRQPAEAFAVVRPDDLLATVTRRRVVRSGVKSG